MNHQHQTAKKYQWDPYNDEDSIVPVSENNTPIQTPKGNRLSSRPSLDNSLNQNSSSTGPTPPSESLPTTPVQPSATSPKRSGAPHSQLQPSGLGLPQSPTELTTLQLAEPHAPGQAISQSSRWVNGAAESLSIKIGVTVSSAPAMPPAPQSSHAGIPSLEEVSRCITTLRAATRDSQVDSAIPQLRPELQHAMLDAILQADPEPSTGRTAVPKLFLDLCQNVRGNVIFHLLRYNLLRAKSGQPPAAYTAPMDVHLRLLVQHIETAWQELAYGKSSSVALSRFMTILPTWALQHIGRTMVQCYPDLLAQHAYGNFLVQDILKVAVQTPEEFEDVFAGLAAKFSPPQTFADLACSKFGSHVIEGFLKAAPPQQNTQLCTPLFQSAAGLEVVRMLGSHEQGNYPLQVVFRLLRQQQSPLFALILEKVIPQLAFCVYRPQLWLAAGLELKEAQHRRR